MDELIQPTIVTTITNYHFRNTNEYLASWQPLCPGLLDPTVWVVPLLAEHEGLAKRDRRDCFIFRRWYGFHCQKWMGAKLFNKNPTKAKDRSCCLKWLLILSTVVNHHFEQNHLGEYFLLHFFQASWPSKSTYSAEWWTKTTSTIVRFQYIWELLFNKGSSNKWLIMRYDHGKDLDNSSKLKVWKTIALRSVFPPKKGHGDSAMMPLQDFRFFPAWLWCSIVSKHLTSQIPCKRIPRFHHDFTAGKAGFQSAQFQHMKIHAVSAMSKK